MTRKIGNVGALDIRNATEESIGDGVECNNVGAVIYSREKAHLLEKIKADNIGSTIECDSDMQVVSGSTEITGSKLGEASEPLKLLVLGKLVVQPDIEPGALDKGLGRLHVSGKVVCPENLRIQSAE